MSEDRIRDPGGRAGETDVVSSIDRSGEHDRLVISELSREDRWLSIRHSEVRSLQAWR